MTKQLLILAALLALTACETPRSNAPVFTVVESNASIPNRSMIQEISLLDDDELLIRVGAGELYRVRLTPLCTTFADVGTAARLADSGPGLDRTTRVIVGDNTCNIRSIERVTRN